MYSWCDYKNYKNITVTPDGQIYCGQACILHTTYTDAPSAVTGQCKEHCSEFPQMALRASDTQICGLIQQLNRDIRVINVRHPEMTLLWNQSTIYIFHTYNRAMHFEPFIIFLLMFNNTWPNSAPLRDIRLQNVSDLDIDLLRSLRSNVTMLLESSHMISY